MKQQATPGHFHAVRFYDSPRALSAIVADFIGEGLAKGLPAIVIATEEHRALIVAALEARFDVSSLQKNDDLIVLDASKTLSKFMVDGVPDAARFRAAIVPVIERACRGRKDCVIRAYGEMVDVLWKAGQSVAAVRLEMLWNELASTHDFALLCGYAMGSFYKDASLTEVQHQHTHLISDSGEAVAVAIH